MLLLFAVTTALRAQIGDPVEWIAIRTAGLELLSTGNQREAQAMFRTLEEARSFFAQLGLRDSNPNRPIRVYAFQSSAEYATVRLSRGTFGHCIRGRHSDYIVLEDIQPRHRRAAIHELAHVVLSRAGYRLPVWLNEGLADVYSTLSLTEGRGTIGAELPARSQALNREPWIDLGTIFNLSNEQRLYTEGNKVAIFYGESWALTHMLMFSPRYASAFPEFTRAISDGRTTAEALESIYRTNNVQLTADLHRYWSEEFIGCKVLKLSPVMQSEPTITALNPFQSSIALAELLGATPATQLKAERLLLSLKEQNPTDPDLQEQLDSVSSANAQAADERAAMTPTSQH